VGDRTGDEKEVGAMHCTFYRDKEFFGHVVLSALNEGEKKVSFMHLPQSLLPIPAGFQGTVNG
jgi:hypothetical protein